jgi:hypothetical protein
LKALLTYRFSRLLVFIVALHTLDVSVDLDHLTNSIGWFDVEKYDDLDSISEFILEGLFHNDKLIKEGKTDDRPRSKNNISHASLIVCWADNIKDWNVNPTCELINNFRPSVRNTRFLFEDHSYADYNPPDNTQPQI